MHPVQRGPAGFHTCGQFGLGDALLFKDPLAQKGDARLYNRGGIGRTKAAMHYGGCIVFWSANPGKDFARSLEMVFKNVGCIGAKAYPKAKRFTHTLFVADRD